MNIIAKKTSLYKKALQGMEVAVGSQRASIMAPATAAPSVIVALHSLVILNISEHWTRVRAQLGKPQRGNLKLTGAVFLSLVKNEF